MPVLRRGDWLQLPDHGAYSVSLSTAFNGFAAADAETFYVCRHEPVSDDAGVGMKVLRKGYAEGGRPWCGHDEALCLVATPADLGIHCQH